MSVFKGYRNRILSLLLGPRHGPVIDCTGLVYASHPQVVFDRRRTWGGLGDVVLLIAETQV